MPHYGQKLLLGNPVYLIEQQNSPEMCFLHRFEDKILAASEADGRIHNHNDKVHSLQFIINCLQHTLIHLICGLMNSRGVHKGNLSTVFANNAKDPISSGLWF